MSNAEHNERAVRAQASEAGIDRGRAGPDRVQAQGCGCWGCDAGLLRVRRKQEGRYAVRGGSDPRCCGGLAASVSPAKAIKSCAGFTPKRAGGRGEVAD